MDAFFVIARYALLEARRSGVPWLVAASLVATLLLSAFLAQVAITETRELQAALVAALLRACAIFIVVTHVVSATVREHNDKVLELGLSLPIARGAYYLGRLAGFAASGALVALASALPLLLFAQDTASVALWGISLALECLLAASLALFFSMTLAQVVPALAASLALYLLGRSMAAIQAIAASPLVSEAALQAAGRHVIDAVALVLPRLDLATRSEWLLYALPTAFDIARCFAGLLAYSLLLAAAGLFDFHRRNL
jgi:ABC-type transport system involved in multi-copper enzyme maturation permease subunit